MTIEGTTPTIYHDNSIKSGGSIINKIWFILGFSGVGKSEFCKHVAEQNNWHYFKIDYWRPGIQDGLDCYGLRKTWNSYELEGQVTPIISEIKRIYISENKDGAVFDFPSSRIIDRKHILTASQWIKVTYLTADVEFCLEARRQRGKLNGESLSDGQWYEHNEKLQLALKDPSLSSFCVRAVKQDGSRKSVKELYEEISNL